MSLHTTEEGRRFLIFAEGKLREKVEEGTEGAKLREGVTPSGEPFSKWELAYPGVTAFITKVELNNGNFGKQVLINLKDENDEEFVLALGAKTKHATNFMQILPNIDLKKEITFKAFSDFKTKEGKEIRGGISITQDGNKIASYFYDKEKDENLHGMPTPEVDKRTKEVDWETYFPIRDKWLQEYLLDNNYMVFSDTSEVSSEPEKTTEEEF